MVVVTGARIRMWFSVGDVKFFKMTIGLSVY